MSLAHHLIKMNPPEVRPPPLPTRNCELHVFDVPRGAHLLPARHDPAGAAIRPSAPCHKRIDQYQEMVDAQNPFKAQAEREQSFMDRLPYVQATSRQLQSHLEIFDDEAWPLPHRPEERQEFNDLLVRTNTERIQSALDACKDYAVVMSRDSRKGQFLDRAMVRRMHTKSLAAKASRGKANTTPSEPVTGLPAAVNQSSHAESARSAKSGKEVAMSGLNSPIPGYDQDGNGIEAASGSDYESTGDEEDHSDEGTYESEEGSLPIDDDTGRIGSVPQEIPAEGIRHERVHSHSFQEQLGKIPTSVGCYSLNRTSAMLSFGVETPFVPGPQDMPASLTEALCNSHQFLVKPILALTFDDVTTSIANPHQQMCVLLHHFEVGLDGVEAIVRGYVQIPETIERKQQREERLQKLGMRKSGDGGFSGALKRAQQDKIYGQGLWVFYGIRYKQTSREKGLGKPAKWLCLGVPREACNKLKVPVGHDSEVVMLGGGFSGPGYKTDRYASRMTRKYLLMCKGGIAPIDAWEGAEDWKEGLLQKVRAAMANNGLRVGYLEHGQGAKELKEKVLLVKEASVSTIAHKIS